MSAMVDGLNRLSAAWAGLVLEAVWQSTLLAFVIGLVARRLRRAGPALRYWLWQIVALKLLIVPVWTLAVPLPAWLVWHEPNGWSSPHEAGRRVGAVEQVPGRRTFPAASAAAARPGVVRPATASVLPVLTVSSGLMVGWLLVLAVEAALVVHQRARLLRLLSRSRSLAGSPLEAQLAGLAAQLGMCRVPEPRVVESMGSPFVCGVLRTWLVLPEGVDRALQPDELRQVLLHELAHVKRGDLLWDWIPALARMLFFFHPVAHWVAGRILLERELACDQAALRLTNQDEAGYAQLLVRVASMASFPLRGAADGETTKLESRFPSLS